MALKDISGINEDAIDKLVLDIFGYVERINQTLKNIDSLVNETSQFYVGESGNKFRNRFNELRANFPIVNQNLLSYTDDLIKVKSGLKNFSSELSIEITDGISNVEAVRDSESSRIS